MRIVIQNEKGFSLVEVVIALVALLLVCLASMQTALTAIESNTVNALRQEAVNIAEEEMERARNARFDFLADSLPEGKTAETVLRNLKSIANFPYAVTREVNNVGTDGKQIRITVTWEWKEKRVASGNAYTHTVISFRTRKQS